MRARLRTLCAALALLTVAAAPPPAEPLIPPGEARALAPDQRAALIAWMTQRGNVRLASLEDCGCEDDVETIRTYGMWTKAIPGYEPYVAVGDFNHDGKTDFAAVLFVTAGEDQYGGQVVIFNGPVSRQSRPAFIATVEPVSHQALVQWPANELAIRPFESEGCKLRPTGNTYTEDCK
jgi:hypothetical protein